MKILLRNLSNGTPTLYATNPVANIDIGIKIYKKSYITIKDINIKRYWSATTSRQSDNILISNVSIYTENVVPSGSQSVGGFSFSDGSHDSALENCLIDGNAWNSINIGGNSYTTNNGVTGWFSAESYNISIKNCTSRNNSMHGLLDFGGTSHNIYIANNNFYNGWSGAVYNHQGHPYRLYFSNNKIYNSSRALYFDGGISDSILENNTIYDIDPTGGHCIQFRTNRVYGKDIFKSSNNIIKNNTCLGDFYYDILALAGNNFLVEHNDVQSKFNDKEYRIDGSGIIRNAVGLKYRASAADSLIIEYTDGTVFGVNGVLKPFWLPDVSKIIYASAVSVNITTYPLTARPISGSAIISVASFDTSLPFGSVLANFTADTTNGNKVAFTASTLKANTNYLIKKGTADYTTVQADSTGKIIFANSVWPSANFTIIETIGSMPTPTPSLTITPSLTPTPTITPTPAPKLSADLNSDGKVNSQDFAILMSAWNSIAKPKADINQDGLVDSLDFGLMMSFWG